MYFIPYEQVARERIRHKPGSRLTTSSPRPPISQLEVMKSATDDNMSQSSGQCPNDSSTPKNICKKVHLTHCTTSEKANLHHNQQQQEQQQLKQQEHNQKQQQNNENNSSNDRGNKGNKKIKISRFKSQPEKENDFTENDNEETNGDNTTGFITGEGSSSSQVAKEQTGDDEFENELEDEDDVEDDEEVEEEEDDDDEADDDDGRIEEGKVREEPIDLECDDVDCVKSSLLYKNNNTETGGNSLSLTVATGTGYGTTSTTAATTTTTTGEISSCTHGSFSEQQRTTRMSSIVTASSSASPVPSKSSVITSSPLKASSVSTATTVVSPSPCVKRKANNASKKQMKKKKRQVDSGDGGGDGDDDYDGETVSKKGKKSTSKKKKDKKEKGTHLKSKVKSSILRSSSRTGSGSKVSQVISNRESIEAKRERKAAKTLAIITGAFVLCWCPFFAMALFLPLCGDSCDPPHQVIESIFQWLGYINSLINPIIYTIFSLEFRAAFKKLGNSILGRPAGFNYRHRPTQV